MSEQLAAARVDKAKDAMAVKPVDLLRAMIHDIETGKLVTDGLAIVWAQRPAEGAWDYGTYRCGMTTTKS